MYLICIIILERGRSSLGYVGPLGYVARGPLPDHCVPPLPALQRGGTQWSASGLCAAEAQGPQARPRQNPPAGGRGWGGFI